MKTRFSAEMVDAGAQALREFEQAGKRLNPWHLVPKAQRRKWLHKAEVVLSAATDVEEGNQR